METAFAAREKARDAAVFCSPASAEQPSILFNGGPDSKQGPAFAAARLLIGRNPADRHATGSARLTYLEGRWLSHVWGRLGRLRLQKPHSQEKRNPTG
jgi:hypothetical protein